MLIFWTCFIECGKQCELWIPLLSKWSMFDILGPVLISKVVGLAQPATIPPTSSFLSIHIRFQRYPRKIKVQNRRIEKHSSVVRPTIKVWRDGAPITQVPSQRAHRINCNRAALPQNDHILRSSEDFILYKWKCICLKYPDCLWLHGQRNPQLSSFSVPPVAQRMNWGSKSESVEDFHQATLSHFLRVTQTQ